MDKFEKYLNDCGLEIKSNSGEHIATIKLFINNCYRDINNQYKKGISIHDCVVNICINELDSSFLTDYSAICVSYGMDLLLGPAGQNDIYSQYHSRFIKIFMKHESVFDAIPIFKNKKMIFL